MGTSFGKKLSKGVNSFIYEKSLLVISQHKVIFLECVDFITHMHTVPYVAMPMEGQREKSKKASRRTKVLQATT